MAEKKNNVVPEEVEDIKIDPIQIFDSNGNFKYLLEFDRASVEFAEQAFGLKPQVVEGDLGSREIRNLFFCAFRKHHQKISKAETDKMLEDMEGLSPEELVRLIQLFELPYSTLIVDDGAKRKNPKLRMKL